jgi:hypothetical protein
MAKPEDFGYDLAVFIRLKRRSRMKKLIFICGLVLACSFSATAQSDFSKLDVFGGYSYVHLYLPFNELGANGGSGQVTYNLNSVLGITGDFGGYHVGSGPNHGSATMFTYLFGPKFSLREGKWTPYAQSLFGGAWVGSGFNGEGSTSFNAFAMVIGAGLEYKAFERISLRLVDFDYLMTRFSSNDIGGTGHTQGNVRISTGVVFHF